MIDLDITIYLLVFCFAMLAAAFQSSAGFGYAIIAMSVWQMFMPYRTASAVETITVWLLSLTLLFRLRKHIRVKLILWPMLATVALMPLGLLTMMNSVDFLMRRLLGGLLLLLAIYFIFFSGKDIKVKPTPRNGLIAGAISGFMGGMFSIGGPPMAIYCLSASENKNEYSACLQMYFALMATYHIVLHAAWGNITADVLRLSVVGAVGLAFGSALGFAVFKRITMPALRRLVYCFMAVFGLYLVILG